MKYQKNFFALVFLFAGLFLLGCKKDKDSDGLSKVDIEKISKLPYSELSPEEQKQKLENESLAFLELCNAAQSSLAVDALQNLNNLLDEAGVDFFESTSEKSAIKVKSVQAAIEYSYFYGVYTWNASKKDWDFSSSKSELKFVFPAKKGSTNNNAALSIKAASSNVLVGELIYMPKSVTCTLTVSNKEEAKIEFSADYKNNNPAPVKTEFKLSTGDGYTYWWKMVKDTESQFTMKLTYKQQTMVEVMFKTGAKFDQIMDQIGGSGDIYKLLDKANGYMMIMDDLALVYTIDLANFIPKSKKIEDDYYSLMWALEDTWPNNQKFFELKGKYIKDYSDNSAKAFNDYVKVGLFSIKDNYKIADIFQKSEKVDTYSDNCVWVPTQNMWKYQGAIVPLYDKYKAVEYLKFNDDTVLAASVYFSEGFDQLENKIEEFIRSFDR